MSIEPTATMNHVIPINYHTFFLQEANGKFIDWDSDPLRENGSIISADYLAQGDKYLCIMSPGHTLRARIEVQRWEVEPPLEAANWEKYADASIMLPSGSIAIDTFMGGGGSQSLAIGQPGGNFHARVYVRGRTHVKELLGNFRSSEVLEDYLAQFWPLA